MIKNLDFSRFLHVNLLVVSIAKIISCVIYIETKVDVAATGLVGARLTANTRLGSPI